MPQQAYYFKQQNFYGKHYSFFWVSFKAIVAKSQVVWKVHQQFFDNSRFRISNFEICQLTFFCTFDAVELYPIIPYKEVLEAILETLDKQEGQNVLTDSLILFTECVLENHFFAQKRKYFKQLHGTAFLAWGKNKKVVRKQILKTRKFTRIDFLDKIQKLKEKQTCLKFYLPSSLYKTLKLFYQILTWC